MNVSRNQIISIIVAVVLLTAGLLAFIFMQDEAQDMAGVTDPGEQNGELEEDLFFDAEAMTNASFTATISGETPDGPIDALMEQDGEGNTRFTTQQNGTEVEFVVTPDSSYTCENGECIRFDSDTSIDSLFNPDNFTYDDEDFEAVREDVVFIGEEDCPAGTCNVWEVHDGEEESRIYVSTDTRQISQVTGEGADGSFSIVYDYRDVTITPPENYEEAPDFMAQ